MYKHPTTGLIVEHEGMELRDWFAGIALPECIGWGEPEKVCARAYIYADEMMKARLGKATFDGETGELKSEVLSRGQE